MADVFRALADPSRRHLLDKLRETTGLSLSELCTQLDMSRQAVSKHVAILETTNLVISMMEGRTKKHYLNPIPLQQIAHRWLQPFTVLQAEALIGLKETLENQDDK